MAGHSSSGMKLYLDKVPIEEDGMTPYDLMLSESQERKAYLPLKKVAKIR